jgi:hypothetical protein
MLVDGKQVGFWKDAVMPYFQVLPDNPVGYGGA